MADDNNPDRQVRNFVNVTLAVVLGAFIFTAGSSWLEGLIAPQRVSMPGLDSLRPVVVGDTCYGVACNESSAEDRAREKQSVREQTTNESGRILENMDPAIEELDHAQ